MCMVFKKPMKFKESQKEVVFYLLYESHKEDAEKYLMAHEFARGEVFIKPLSRWSFASYKCPARLSEIYNENPGLLERKKIRGKSDAVYYAYRITVYPKVELIKDEALLAFYQKIKSL